MKTKNPYQHATANRSFAGKVLRTFFPLVLIILSFTGSAQLATYDFTGTGACPNQNPSVVTQPANAVFSDITSTGVNCAATDNEFVFSAWNTSSSINLSEYHQFTITPSGGYAVTLTGVSFTHYTSVDNGSGAGTQWALRSSLDNYSANIATGSANTTAQSASVTLPAAFTNTGAITFRLYIIEAKDNGTNWSIDDLSVNGSVVMLPADPANPVSNSPQCASSGITLTTVGTAPAGETWYWQTTANGTSTANGGSTYTVSTSGTYYIRSQDNTTLAWSAGAGSVTVTVTPSVSAPVFAAGATSSRCQGASVVTYTASSTNSTGITYSIDAASIAGGVTIDANTGAVNFPAGWVGATIVTATATGCEGPKTSNHTVTTAATIGTPVFALGASSFRCVGGSTFTYTATATNATGITYSLDALSIIGGNSIVSSTGAVNFSALWIGTTVVTATANGCGGPKTATHSVTINSAVATPVFVLGATSTRCPAAEVITYTANAANTSGITYSLDATSTAAGNSIDPVTGAVTYTLAWTGTSTITASAAGCNGPKTATHTVTTRSLVSTPVFVAGASSTRCQGTGSVTYTASAANTTGITYTLDAASIAGGNTINGGTGAVTFAAGWSGTTFITASAAGCSGPLSATHTVTVTPTVGTPVFSLGATSIRCQGAGSITYSATASNATGISYALDAASIAAGNSIVSTTGAVTFVAGWSGTSTVTASATGCNGPKTATHIITISGMVAAPAFTLGPVSSRLQGAGSVTYSASAVNSTGITYSLDAASLAAGNTINTATGAVTYTAMWNGTSTITASAAGCGGPKTSTHVVTINATLVIKQLYLSDPSQALDRIDPVNSADLTTASSALLSTAGTTSTTFTMNPALCDSLVIKAGTITIKNYITVSSGTMPSSPAITAVLKYGATTILSINNPTYAGGILTWTATLPSDVTVPAGQAISLQVTTAVAGVTFRIDFDSQSKPSKIDLPVSTFIKILSVSVYSAAYPGGTPVVSSVSGVTRYIRATVTDPFGATDITALNVKITPTGSTVAATSVATSGCTRTYEYAWTTPATGGTYGISATAKEGLENTVSDTKDISFNVCSTCAPIAVNDIASGAGGTPIVVNVLSNDYDPNNNINAASLAISVEPRNGSAYISGSTIIYLPNGMFSGKDTLTYQVCDLTSPAPLCATAQVVFTIDPTIIDICADAAKTHTYYIPYPEQQSYTALEASGSPSMPSNNIRTVISIKIPYPGMKIVWDEWEDGYEANASNPTQSSTKVWGDGNPYNGIAPGYSSDIIPAGGSIILDNTMPANPRNSANIFYDGKDKVVSSGQVALTQVSGEPSIMSVQSIKTNVTSTYDFGQSFTIPLGQDFPSQDFKYTALFIRASQNNTTVSIDKDNNGTFETVTTLNEGGSYLLNGGVLTGATVASDKPVGVELNAGGIDNYSIRNAPIYPATWYSNTYYTPVPTSDNAGDNPKDTSVVMFYNSLNRAININWYSGAPANGVIAVPAKSAVRFPLAYSTTAAYKFVNLTGESFTAIEIVNSYSPGGGGTSGTAYDWSFNLISEARLTDYTTVAWAPGGLDLAAPAGPDVNGNPIWVTPSANTTIYVKYDGNVSGTTGLVSPCGLRYDVSYPLNALSYIRIRDTTDNDQGGIAIYTCNGAKIAAAYGEDPMGSTAGNSAYWDVGSTIQPFCKSKLMIATDDYATTLVGQPVTISVLNNDFGFLATIDPSTVTTMGLLQPAHGTVTVNDNGTILYTPNPTFSGVDTFEYNVCSTPSVVCDVAMVIVKISSCPSNGNQNVISGQVFIDRNKDATNNDGGFGLNGVKVYLYTDGDCSGTGSVNELTDSVTVDSSGFYQFMKYPEKTIEDNFDGPNGTRTCANGSDGDSPWGGNWTDVDPASSGFCQSVANADIEITRDGAFGFGLRIKDNDVSATRALNLSGATKAFLTFSYRRKSTSLTAGEDIYVQASSNGTAFTTIYTISGTGATDADYVTIYNQDISAFASSTTAIRFQTNPYVDDADTVYIDNVSIRFLKYPQCYVTAIDASTVPAGYTATTVTTKAMTISSGGSCASYYDFGYAKPNITVSGTLRNDKNGLVDNLVNGTGIGAPGGTTVYAYLVDATGKIAFKTTVNSSTGAYSFPLAEVNTEYTLVLSTTNTTLGSSKPVAAGFPSLWAIVGDAYGTNNLAGSGAKPGVPNASVTVKTGATAVTNVDFGIQRLPDTDDYLVSINHPVINQFITLNGGANPPVLSGSDPEDCTAGCVLTTKSVTIDKVPTNAELYYNNVLVTNGQLLSSFNPSLLKVKITAATLGDTTIAFLYSYVDAANMKDPTPAIYRMSWLIPLPADRLVAVANLEGNTATIEWSTLSEQNTSHYIVERSIDNKDFKATGNPVAAAGNSADKREYQLQDNISGLSQQTVIYYRVKLVDLDGKISYSNTVAVRLSQKPGVTIWPNPFQSSITISITTTRETDLEIKMVDVNGRYIRSLNQHATRGTTQVSIRDLERLPAGVYLVEITDKLAGTTFQKIVKNN